MSASNRDYSITQTLKYEGGYTNHPSDPGGPTNWGITIHDARMYWKADATAGDVKAMPLSVAIQIYRQRYWDKMNCDADPAGVDFVTYDYGVNSGTGRAVPLREKTRQADTVRWVKAYCAARLAFLHRLKTWEVFGKGWGRRVIDVEARGVKMALAAKGLPAPEVSKELKKEAKGAATQAKKDAAKAGAAPAAPASTQVPDAPHHIEFSSIPTWSLVAVGIVVACAVGYFGYRWYINYKRAQAFTAVATED